MPNAESDTSHTHKRCIMYTIQHDEGITNAAELGNLNFS